MEVRKNGRKNDCIKKEINGKKALKSVTSLKAITVLRKVQYDLHHLNIKSWVCSQYILGSSGILSLKGSYSYP